MRRRAGLMLGLLVALLPICLHAAASQTVSEAVQRRLDRALSLPSDAQRLRELDRLAKEFSGTAMEDFVRGYKLGREGKSAEAEAAFHNALAKDEKFAEAHHQLGLLFFSRRDYEAARDEFDRAASIRPGQAIYWKNLGRALRRLRESSRAAEAFRRAISLDPRDSECQKFLAFALDEAGASAEASAQYDRAIRLDPRDALLRANQAGLLERRGRIAEAERAYRAALDINPREQMAVVGLTLLLEKQNDQAGAIGLLEKAIEYGGAPAENYAILARLYEQKGERKKAEENYRLARDLEPTNAFYAWQYAQMFESSGRVEEALQEYKRGILLHPHQPMFYSSLALLALRLHRQADVLAWLEEVNARNANVAELHAWIGYLYWETGRLDEAEDHYARAAKLDPLNRDYANMLARIRQRRGQEWRWWYAPLFAAAVALALYLFRQRRPSAS